MILLPFLLSSPLPPLLSPLLRPFAAPSLVRRWTCIGELRSPPLRPPRTGELHAAVHAGGRNRASAHAVALEANATVPIFDGSSARCRGRLRDRGGRCCASRLSSATSDAPPAGLDDGQGGEEREEAIRRLGPRRLSQACLPRRAAGQPACSTASSTVRPCLAKTLLSSSWACASWSRSRTVRFWDIDGEVVATAVAFGCRRVSVVEVEDSDGRRVEHGSAAGRRRRRGARRAEQRSAASAWPCSWI
jgi:hypothetical protein